MSGFALLLALGSMLAAATTPPTPPTPSMPAEVDAFIAQRDLCDHFRSEPFEGAGAEAIARRDFIRDNIDRHCTGTDRRLSALKRRYRHLPAVLVRLDRFEACSQAPCESAPAAPGPASNLMDAPR